MIFLTSILLGILSAALGAFAAGLVALAAVKWYHISGREGASGYFVATMGLIGLVVSLVIGIVCGFITGADSGIGFLKGIGLAFGIILTLGGFIALLCRLLADIPPKIDGQELFLIVEARWPADRAAFPPTEPGEAYLRLGSLNGKVLRKNVRGPLWKERAQLVDGRWTVQGAVQVFTSRGKRMLQISLNEKTGEGFLLPLPAFPGRKYQQWSDWLPRPRRDGKPPGNQITYRFRIQRWSEPMRVESLDNFEIVTVTRGFNEEYDRDIQHIVSRDAFRINYRGKPLKFDDKPEVAVDSADSLTPINLIVTFPNHPSTMLLNVTGADYCHRLFLVSEVDDAARIEFLADSSGSPTIICLSPTIASETSAFNPTPNRRVLNPGIYLLLGFNVFDTRTMSVHRYTPSTASTELGDFCSLRISPDQRSFVRFTFAAGTSNPELTVTDFVADKSYVLPIDRRRMHYIKTDELRAPWVSHHFRWQRDANEFDRLVEIKDFKPLPYRGEIHHESDGKYAFHLENVSEGMRGVLEEVLVKQFNAERLLSQPSDYEHGFQIKGQKIVTTSGDSFHFARVSMDAAIGPVLASAIADGFNAELATGKHDEMFLINNP